MAHCHDDACAYCRADELFAEDYRETHGRLRTYDDGCRCPECTEVYEVRQAKKSAAAERSKVRRRAAYALTTHSEVK